MAGVVSQVNEKGLKLEGRGDAWLNFSKPEYRGHFQMPQKGDNVKLGVNPYKDTYFIQTCEIQRTAQYENGQVPAGGRELSITRSVAIKAATDIAVALIAQGRYQDEPDFAATKQLGIDVPALAQDFERWLIREEIAFD
jgi:hypothetical protein